MPDEDLDKILEDLKNDQSIASLADQPQQDRIDVDKDNINDYVIQKVARLIETGIETVESIKQTIASGFEVDELQAFSALIGAVTSAADTLNKINLQQMKAKSAKQLKKMDIASKKQLGNGGGHGGNTNVLIATREEVIERFLNNKKEFLEADFTTEEPEVEKEEAIDE